MIVGRGMVADAIKNMTGWEDDILFSSGVSNSGEQDSAAFQKETDLLKRYLSQLKPGFTFVYFSTTSIFDPAKSNSYYILHKLYIENLIKESGVNFLIIRLPNLVGVSKNPHTLTNFFVNCIQNGKPIKLKSDAIRHLIDVSDLDAIINDINQKFGKQKVIVNVETDNPLNAGQILKLLEEVLSKKADIAHQTVETAGLISSSNEDISSKNYIWKTGENYHRNLFRKYYSV